MAINRDFPLAPSPSPDSGTNKKDSLMESSNKKKETALMQERIGKTLVKKGLGDKEIGHVWSGVTVGTPTKIPTGKERLEIAKKLRTAATKDSIAATKYK